ncbi:RES domain-containing protein [Microvirga tunisiensis]|uniref:RES domain-containing protein n=1 Tax=Microvirga tunisiensis TaxID=2108360 RepID=A0A5N7MAN0_9HYPH|nr:RES domain-containing protein [Microvirga tunisiensis]MPR05607.1 RES domain-containing protein [Microvirga tunisiensis]MPR23807.1 RES domain-containing protein [Microvirga tunisiensis]
MRDYVDQLKEKRICSECVGEPYLQDQIEESGQEAECDYCNQTGRTFTIEDMASLVEVAFQQHYERTETQPDGFEYAMQREGIREWEREGEETIDVIGEAAQIDVQPATDVQEILADRYAERDPGAPREVEYEFEREARYTPKKHDDAEWHTKWRQFEHVLKTQTRFFSQEAADTLKEIFGSLDGLKTQAGRSVIIEVGPGTEFTAFYRARTFESDDTLQEALEAPERKLGPAPSSLSKDGRMNARGISVFYGSSDPIVALAEVRPPVGSKVLVGRFDVTRSLRLLDLSALQEVEAHGSLFDPAYVTQIKRAKFLDRLSRRITIPVMPNDEPFEYLATQAIADYLATEASPTLDGILFPSVQAGRGQSNVVLFYKAARVQAQDLPEGSRITASVASQWDDGLEPHYWVSEEVPETPKAKKADQYAHFFGWDEHNPVTQDNRDPSLKLDVQSLVVHHIAAVEFRTTPYSVDRSRIAMLTDEENRTGDVPDF